MRNLIVCCDGTWNTPDQEASDIPSPTNVLKIYNAVTEKDASGKKQLKYYHPGVGTEGNWWQKVKGGAFGFGLSQNVMSSYAWLARNYKEGDRIFLFGFSRGAYTVRSLGGMISLCGLLNLRGLKPESQWSRVETAFDMGYRKRRMKSSWRGNWKVHKNNGKPVDIHFMGLWDTVGALGIPDNLAILNVFDDRDNYVFHDVELSKLVVHARHALALDEKRGSFSPTLWEKVGNRKNVKQVWFTGCHSDVGGGYAHSGLSDVALNWMMTESVSLGLDLSVDMQQQVAPDPQGVLHNSLKGMYKNLGTSPRAIPCISSKSSSSLHSAVLSRQANPPISQAPYHKTIELKVGESHETSVYAIQRWNNTALYLLKNAKYEFTATGQWLDKSVPTGPKGAKDGKFHRGEIAHIAGSIMGKLEGLFKKLTGNEGADFIGSRRYEDFPWFALVGAVANSVKPVKTPDGSTPGHEAFLIGEGVSYTPSKSGYLYAFANDAWHFYDNNRGSVRLKVKRIN